MCYENFIFLYVLRLIFLACVIYLYFSGGKEMDDGNIEDYNARLKLWEKERGEEDRGSHQLSGGLEVPNCIWNNLYK